MKTLNPAARARADLGLFSLLLAQFQQTLPSQAEEIHDAAPSIFRN